MSDDTPKFSVLMAIYIKDSPLFLSEALQSIYKKRLPQMKLLLFVMVRSHLNSILLLIVGEDI